MIDVADFMFDLSEDDTAKTVNVFKAFFLTEEGQFILARMLEKLKFLEHSENEQDMALNNFAKDLLATIYWDEKTKKADTGGIMRFVAKHIGKQRRIR